MQVNGFVAAFEATGLQGYGQAVLTFFNKLVAHHSYVTGGSNQGEFWGPPDNVADAVTDVRLPCSPPSSCKLHLRCTCAALGLAVHALAARVLLCSIHYSP